MLPKNMRIIGVVLLLAVACSFQTNNSNDAPPPPPPSARRQAEVVAGAGRVKAGVVTIDVEVGRSVPITQVKAGAVTISGAPVVRP